MNDTLKITISGPQGCGKSVAATLISEALAKYGWDVEVDIGDGQTECLQPEVKKWHTPVQVYVQQAK